VAVPRRRAPLHRAVFLFLPARPRRPTAGWTRSLGGSPLEMTRRPPDRPCSHAATLALLVPIAGRGLRRRCWGKLADWSVAVALRAPRQTVGCPVFPYYRLAAGAGFARLSAPASAPNPSRASRPQLSGCSGASTTGKYAPRRHTSSRFSSLPNKIPAREASSL
jgi:hypothetical protein